MKPEPSEYIFFSGHPSWRSMLGFYVKWLLGALLAGTIAGVASAAAGGRVQPIWVIVVVLIVFVAGLTRGALRCARTTYTITDRRLSVQYGLFSRDVRETRLERVQNVSARQTLVERMLAVGTIDFDTAAGPDFDLCFSGVEHPRRVVRAVDRALHQHHPAARL